MNYNEYEHDEKLQKVPVPDGDVVNSDIHSGSNRQHNGLLCLC